MPRKRFGQNFLQDTNMIHAIVRVMNLSPKDNVIEIGPGMGALTRPLLARLNHLTVVEIDRDLQAVLQAFPEALEGRLTVMGQDVLKIDWTQFDPGFRVVGNLPYNISTPLLIALLSHAARIQDMYFMLQKEVALRLSAAPGSKTYGRLSVMAQMFCKVSYVLDVPPEVFYPKPKVDSAIVHLTPHTTSLLAPNLFKILEWVVAKSFAMRRKTLANNLKAWVTADDLQRLGLDPKSRPETLSVEEYGLLAKGLIALGVII